MREEKVDSIAVQETHAVSEENYEEEELCRLLGRFAEAFMAS
jgi:hypothetical protein